MGKIDPAVEKELKEIKKAIEKLNMAVFKEMKPAIDRNVKAINQHANVISGLHGIDKKSLVETVKKAAEDAVKASKK